MGAAPSTSAERSLPEIRQDLQLYEGPEDGCGNSWLIYDPVRHRYFSVSQQAFELLQRWRPERATELAMRMELELERPIPIAQIEELERFIVASNLAVSPASVDARALAAQEIRSRHALGWRLVHNYLFFKVPLVRPERFLQATLPLVEPLFSKTVALLVAAMGAIGLYLASRQWDLFVATFLDLLSLEGAAGIAISIVAIKALHELGHAYSAVRLGVRVPTMGVAFMVLTPILFTDVTDAWRLTKRRDKLAIDIAGVVVEMGIACIALFLWSFLPDGPLRSVAFVTATTSLVMGLLINLNPLMRFDGYYILSDAWRVPNLQSRSSELAVWRMRELLFDLQHPPPQMLPRSRQRLMIGYALCMWIYRLGLFIGIALVVYHMFFKILGVLLFVVEIVWFILRPVGHEVTEWWRMRGEIVERRRSLTSGAVGVALVGLIAVPWSGVCVVQGVVQAGSESVLYAPRAARVSSIAMADRQLVSSGQILLTLSAPDLDYDVQRARQQIELTRLQLGRIAGDDIDRSNRMVLARELERHRANLAGLEQEMARLIIRAPHLGTLRDIDRELSVNEWIDETMPIGRIVDQERTIVSAYVAETEYWRIATGARAVFVPEIPTMAALEGRVVEIAQTATRRIDVPYLASVFGGAIQSDRDKESGVVPRSGQHLIKVELAGQHADRAIRGTLHLAGKPESIAAAIWRQVLRVLVRESGA